MRTHIKKQKLLSILQDYQSGVLYTAKKVCTYNMALWCIIKHWAGRPPLTSTRRFRMGIGRKKRRKENRLQNLMTPQNYLATTLVDNPSSSHARSTLPWVGHAKQMWFVWPWLYSLTRNNHSKVRFKGTIWSLFFHYFWLILPKSCYMHLQEFSGPLIHPWKF